MFEVGIQVYKYMFRWKRGTTNCHYFCKNKALKKKKTWKKDNPLRDL